jgi:hypothetical protein
MRPLTQITLEEGFQFPGHHPTRPRTSSTPQIPFLFYYKHTGLTFLLTSVYGQTDLSRKMAFLTELRTINQRYPQPLLLLRYFNLLRSNQVILGQVSGPNYTWSSKKPTPTFSKLDRVFLSFSLSLNCSAIQLHLYSLIYLQLHRITFH